MKLKNVKIGVRVVLKEDSDNKHLKKGAIGTIQENGDLYPFVEWDNFEKGHMYNNAIWSVPIEQLKRIK